MKLIRKLQDSLVDRIAEAVWAGVAVVLMWAAYQVVPAVLPAIESNVPGRVIVALLAVSFVLNLLFALLLWRGRPSETPLRLKYGILWDRDGNPHCPACRTPTSAYGKFGSGRGYHCPPCNKTFRLADASGREVEPERAQSEL
jgi:hypothetical protein